MKLNDEQIKNWRKILCVTLGPYAMLMTKEQIQEFRNKTQKNVDKIGK